MAAGSAARFGLMGEHLCHSWSREIHKALGSWPYELIELDAAGAEELFTRGSWDGLNVTIPHKALAARVADEPSERVLRTGAANTLVRRSDGSIAAENTDVLGFASLLERFSRTHLADDAHGALGGKKALVLGSGGASSAVCAALEDAGVRPVVISRTGTETYEGLELRHADAALIVNTTPVGMYPACPATPLAGHDLARFQGLLGVIDVIYNPLRTKLLMDAEELGIPTANGLWMLVEQARHASQIFQETRIDEALSEAIEAELAAGMANIMLIGMPGTGKTTTGKRLARSLGRPFIDLDDAVTIEQGMSPAQMIEGQGVAAFRKVETEVLCRYGRESGLVIACGGGVVTMPENYQLAHQNSTIVLLRRDASTLSAAGRPISAQVGVEELARERGPLYERWADLSIDCTGTPDGDASLILQTLGGGVSASGI